MSIFCIIEIILINHLQDGRHNMKHKRLNPGSLSEKILDCIASGHDDLLAGFINPRTAINMGSTYVLQRYFGNKTSRQVKVGINRLKKRGSLSGDVGGYKITSMGWSDHLTARVREAAPYSDGRSLMILFDIPETRRRDRNKLRNLLVAGGCVRLQQSVYVTPFDILYDLKVVLEQSNLYQCVRMYYTELAI